MYCGQCNIDFPEGLRYCKWCGQPLVDSPRTTGEIQQCPTCHATVQGSWVFCKACGAKLGGQPPVRICPHCRAEVAPSASACLRCGEKLSAQSEATRAAVGAGGNVTNACPSCGEQLDTASLYCKACGSRAPSSLLCPSCKTYSPVGSTACRVCGTPLKNADVQPAETKAKSKPGTLPDLSDRLAERGAADVLTDSADNTAIIRPGIESRPPGATGRVTEIIQEGKGEGLKSERPGGAETNVLPGVGGAEPQPSTSVLKKGRITNPVEGAEPGASDRALAESTDALGTPGPDVDETVELAARSRPSTPDEMAAFFRTQETPIPGRSAQTKFDGDSSSGELRQGYSQPQVQLDSKPEALESQTTGAAGSSRSAPQGHERRIKPTHAFAEPTVGELTPPRTRHMAIIGPVVAAVVLLGLAAILYWQISSRGKPTTAKVDTPPATPTVAPTAVPTAAPSPAETPNTAVPADMVFVSAGKYIIGREDGDPLERPPHEVELAPFYIDRTEVTNSAYKKFVDATSHKPPQDWENGSFPAGKDNLPVVGVTWQDAVDYGKWAGRRLPSEAEWEAAARGLQAFTYPWGNEWRTGMANIGTKSVVEVGQYKNSASPSGALDMIGNVWEWTADEFKLYPGGVEAVLAGLKLDPRISYRVMRGGAYDGGRQHDCSYRGLLDGALGYPKVGFRLVKDGR